MQIRVNVAATTLLHVLDTHETTTYPLQHGSVFVVKFRKTRSTGSRGNSLSARTLDKHHRPNLIRLQALPTARPGGAAHFPGPHGSSAAHLTRDGGIGDGLKECLPVSERSSTHHNSDKSPPDGRREHLGNGGTWLVRYGISSGSSDRTYETCLARRTGVVQTADSRVGTRTQPRNTRRPRPDGWPVYRRMFP